VVTDSCFVSSFDQMCGSVQSLKTVASVINGEIPAKSGLTSEGKAEQIKKIKKSPFTTRKTI
jgi:hypothetical protein